MLFLGLATFLVQTCFSNKPQVKCSTITTFHLNFKAALFSSRPWSQPTIQVKVSFIGQSCVLDRCKASLMDEALIYGSHHNLATNVCMSAESNFNIGSKSMLQASLCKLLVIQIQSEPYLTLQASDLCLSFRLLQSRLMTVNNL